MIAYTYLLEPSKQKGTYETSITLLLLIQPRLQKLFSSSF